MVVYQRSMPVDIGRINGANPIFDSRQAIVL